MRRLAPLDLAASRADSVALVVLVAVALGVSHHGPQCSRWNRCFVDSQEKLELSYDQELLASSTKGHHGEQY